MHERKHSERLGLYEVRERGSKVRDIAGRCEYEDTLVTLELSGQQLTESLDHSAQYFCEYEQENSLAKLIDQRVPATTLTWPQA